MKNLCFCLFLMIIFISCKNDLDKSVLTPLSSDVISELYEKDTTFIDFYEGVRFLADSTSTSEVSRLRYSPVTYNSLKQFIEIYRIRLKDLTEDENSKVKYQNRFGKDLEAFKLDSTKYVKYIKENSYDNFLELIHLGLYDANEEDEYINMNFFLMPKKNVVISKFMGGMKFVPKEIKSKPLTCLTCDSEGFMVVEFINIGNDKVWGVGFGNFSSLTKHFNVPQDVIKQKYRTEIFVDELVLDDRYIDVKFDSVPLNMKQYLTDYLEHDKSEYIRGNINNDFLIYEDYLEDVINEDLKSQYSNEIYFMDADKRIY